MVDNWWLIIMQYMIKIVFIGYSYPLSIVVKKNVFAVSFFLLLSDRCCLFAGRCPVSPYTFVPFLRGGIRNRVPKRGGDGLLPACRELVRRIGRPPGWSSRLLRRWSSHDDVFIPLQGRQHKCRYDACAPLPDEQWITTWDNCCPAENIEKIRRALFFGVLMMSSRFICSTIH